MPEKPGYTVTACPDCGDARGVSVGATGAWVICTACTRTAHVGTPVLRAARIALLTAGHSADRAALRAAHQAAYDAALAAEGVRRVIRGEVVA